jgi:hypothetical protein
LDFINTIYYYHVKKLLGGTAKKIIAPVLISILLIVFTTLPLVMCAGGGGAAGGGINGIYFATDTTLTSASEYYTKLAFDFNDNIIGINSDWKGKLSALGVDTTNYTQLLVSIFGMMVLYFRAI